MYYKNKFRWYLNENDGWSHLIEQQADEIPQMEKVLLEVTPGEAFGQEKLEFIKLNFGKQLALQHQQMNNLNLDIAAQQKLLTQECANTLDNNGIDAYCTQDKLRERIKEIEKSYLDLKYNFMTYLSTIL